MDILCPKHHTPMHVERIKLESLDISAYVARCPKCDCQYIDRYIFKATSSITISGIRYEFLPELSDSTEILRKKEQEEAAKILREKEIIEQKKLKAEAEKLKQQKKIEKQKRKWEKAEEKRRLYRDNEAARLKTLFRDSPNHFYRASFVSYYDGTAPTVCPVDGEQLIYLSNAHYHSYKGGLCCLRCSRIYIPKDVPPAERKPRSSSTKVKLSSSETIAQNIKLQEENPSRAIKPLEVLYYSDDSLRRCIADHTDLIKVNNIKMELKRDASGLWCPLCNRCYIREYKRPKKTPLSVFSTLSCATSNGVERSTEDTSYIPKSTILVVKLQNLSSRDDIFTVTVVTDEHEQDSKRDILWVGRGLPSHIMVAIQTAANKEFEFKNRRYRIIESKEYPFCSKYLRIVARFCNPMSPQPIYVFSHKNIPSSDNTDFECVTAMIPCANKSFPVPLNVYFQKSTHMYFINEVTYSDARKRYGLPYLRLCSPENTALSDGYSTKLKPHSLLNLLGYSVSSYDGLSDQMRRVLLANIINSRVMTKAEVINHIEWLIHSREHMDHMENAVSAWKDDLNFLRKFNADYQRTICASSLHSKFTSVNL